ncbi:MAG: biotin--[acetyl-CoA-carboxylase] ligase [Desulfobacterales bacterium]|nr:biotin--[acetyl-CoA-carboxylase] ligase [Desulfobacterales bacterium]
MSTKDILLSDLKKNINQWISGEEISRKLSISRAAVSKQIGQLRKKGYEIESLPRKGYMLTKVSDLILADEILDGLDTDVFGKKEIICLDKTDSTNTRAKDLAANGAGEGTIVLAEEQGAGRGRKGRKWFSPPGDSIYASLILRPAISPGEAPVITLLTAVVAAETLLSMTDLNPRIKWPNDILINGKKISGILTEISTDMDAVDFVVVGIGLNVNTPLSSFPDEIKDIATSILAETGEHLSRTDIIREFLKQYEHFYSIFTKEGFGPIIKRWKELADIIGKRISVDMISKKHIGTVIDVDNTGVLIMEDDEGRDQRIISGDVTIMC